MSNYDTKEAIKSIPADKFEFAYNPDILVDKTFSGVASWRDKLNRFCKNKGAMFGAIFIILLTTTL